MKTLIFVLVAILIPAIAYAGKIVVVIYHYEGQIIQISQCYQSTKLSRILQFCPPGEGQNYEYFTVPDSLKVSAEGRGWTINKSAAQVKYQPGIADSIKVSAYQNGTQAYRDSVDATLR